MPGERFLVTGALGCIGSWVVRMLLREGVQVWTFDLPGKAHRLELILEAQELEALQRIEGDITDQKRFERVVADQGISHIVHLAALQVPFVRADPVLGARVNVVGTTIVFETVKRHLDEIKGLAYASSIGVYGSADRYPPGPLANDAKLDPPNLYGVFKQANEGTAKVFWEEHEVSSVGLRPYVVYGPGRDQGWTSTPTKAMLSAVLGRTFSIGIGGRMVLHHAEDVARAFIEAARKGGKGAPVFNLGGTTAGMAEVVESIEATLPSARGTITFEDTPLPFPSEIDDGALRRALGHIEWRPLEVGIRETILFFERAVKEKRLDVERALAP